MATGDAAKPHTFHSYVYALADPVNTRDPSGLSSLSEYSQALITQFTLQTTAIYSAGRVVVTMNYRVGKLYEKLIQDIIRSEVPGVESLKVPRALTGPGGKRIHDLMVQIGEELFILEAKYGVQLGGAAYQRLVNQIQTYTDPNEVSGARVILVFSEKAAQLALERARSLLSSPNDQVFAGIEEMIVFLRNFIAPSF